MNPWTLHFKPIYEHAVARYSAGEHDVATYFDPEQLAFLRSIGCKPQSLFDYAEDSTSGGQPDWETVLLMVAARRDFFLYAQHGVWNDRELPMAELPAKNEELGGIRWLPRIIRKALSYLEGTESPDTMFCCAGDRRFLENHGLHPADFLRTIWHTKSDAQAMLRYVESRGTKF